MGNGEKETIFFPPKSEELAEIVQIDTPENAKRSARKLLSEYRKATTKARRKKIRSAAILAANRAKVISRNRRISLQQRKEAKRVERIYRSAVKKMRSIR